jgi:predicted unusual protein kinase regulating ubiquinone biosynthesis (AarF/ABC1/UbiB family)
MISLIQSLVEYNPLYIKIFQSLSGHNFHPRIRAEMLRQTSSAYCKPMEVDCACLNSVGDKYDIDFKETIMPASSGMIALVFFGTMPHPITGKEINVVLKTKRRNIYNRVAIGHDEFITLYNAVCFIVRTFIPFELLIDATNSLRSMCDTKQYILTQCDFRHESKAISVTRAEIALLVAKGHCTLYVPEVYASGDDFILMEQLDGSPLSDYDNVAELGDQHINDLAFYTWISSYKMSYCHTDLHSGNIFHMKKNGKAMTGIIDFGMHIRINNNSKSLMNGLVNVIVKKSANKDAKVECAWDLRHTMTPVVTRAEYDMVSVENKAILNELYASALLTVFSGVFDEAIMHKVADAYRKYVNPKIVISYEGVQLLMSLSMAQSAYLRFGFLTETITGMQKKQLTKVMTIMDNEDDEEEDGQQ